MNRAWVVIGVLAMVTPALADDDEGVEGAACATSADCGSLKCIGGACRNPNAVKSGEAPAWETTVGHQAMFGTGKGYITTVIVTDIAATATEPFLMASAMGSMAPTQTVLGVLCFAPVGFAGTIVHLVHGRFVPAVISFFAWTSLAGTTFAVGGLFGEAFQQGFEFNNTAAWAAGLVFGAIGATGLTTLDAYMARPVATEMVPHTAGVHITPGIMPTRGGALASLGGSW